MKMKDRREYIGGSDIAAIFGVCSYKTPLQLYLEKTSEEELEHEDNEYCYWGRALEDDVRQAFSERNGLDVRYTQDIIIHPSYDFMRAHLDGFIDEENAVLEIKCASSYMSSKWGEPETDNIPLNYLFQVAYYCFITGADKAYIAALIGGNTYRQYVYKRNRELESNIVKKVFEFWHCVQTRTPPKASNTEDAKLLYTMVDDTSIVADRVIYEKYAALLGVKKQKKDLEKKEKQLKMDIVNFMQNKTSLSDEGGEVLVTWKLAKNGQRVMKIKGDLE